jgi:hypothetical protein
MEGNNIMRKLTILFMFLLLSFAVHAQEGEDTLTYGDSVTGEITNRNFEVEYSFQGSGGEVVIVELVPDEAFEGLSQPSLLILNAEFDVLSTVDAYGSAAVLAYEVPQDGQYFILATRKDGRGGESEGGYTLNLTLVPMLHPGEVIEGRATNEQPGYYGVKTNTDFDVFYRRGDGDFYPAISINVLEEGFLSDDNLESIATLEGESLKRGSLGVGLVGAGETLFIVTVNEPLLQFNFEEKAVSYTLEMTQP